MGLGPVSFQPAVSIVIREMLWGDSSRSPSLQPNLWFTPYPVGLYSGNSSLKAQGGLECVETGWGWGEEPRSYSVSREGVAL